MFVNSVIKKVNENSWKLTITFSFYLLYNYDEVYVYSTKKDCIDKLMSVRCYDRIRIDEIESKST